MIRRHLSSQPPPRETPWSPPLSPSCGKPQPDAEFGRILAAYGGVFVVGSLLWGMAADGFRPDRYDVLGATACVVGVAVIMYAPRAGVLDG